MQQLALGLIFLHFCDKMNCVMMCACVMYAYNICVHTSAKEPLAGIQQRREQLERSLSGLVHTSLKELYWSMNA